MWTASIRTTKFENGQAVVIVDYTDDSGQPMITEVLRPSSTDEMNTNIQGRLSQMNAAFALISSVATGPYTPPEPPVDVVAKTVVATPPTPAQAAQDQFLSDYSLLQAMQRAITAGLKTATDKDYVDLKAKVSAEFLPEYVALI